MKGLTMTPEQFWAQVDLSRGDDACWPWRGPLWNGGRLATEYGIDDSVVSRIVNRRSWKHVR